MKIKPHYFLLFFAMFIALATCQQVSQQACDDSQEALVANSECTSANVHVQTYLQGFEIVVSRETLNIYCSGTCRNLRFRITADCITDDDERDIQLQRNMAFTNLVCSIKDDENCIEFLLDDEVIAFNTALGNNQCSFFNNEERCSDSCSMIVENFINAGECCTPRWLEFNNNQNHFNVTYNQLLSYCELDPPQFTPCETIYINGTRSGAKGLKNFAYGIIMMITLTAVTLF